MHQSYHKDLFLTQKGPKIALKLNKNLVSKHMIGNLKSKIMEICFCIGMGWQQKRWVRTLVFSMNYMKDLGKNYSARLLI